MLIAKYTFRNVGGLWLTVDSESPNRPTLADYLKKIDLNIDDSCQFGRFIRYYKNSIITITYRAWNMSKVTITITRKDYE